MILTIASAAFLAALPTASTPAPRGAAFPAPAHGSNEALGHQLLDVIGSGDERRARDFFSTAFSPASAEFEPRERTLRRLLALTRDSGGPIVVSEWHAEGERLYFDGRTARGLPVQGMVGVKGGRIMSFELQRDPLARGADAPAWPPTARTPSDAVSAIAREIDWRAASGRFSGAVLIAHQGRPVLERAWGMARRSPNIQATPATLFNTASAGKLLTSIAIGRLIDAGRLSLDMKVAAAVPALAGTPHADSVTIGELLGHRVSYGDYFDEARAQPEIARRERATERLALLAGRTPERAPEGRFRYSNGNYLVLAAAIEAASGQPYRSFVEEEVMKPLGLTRMRFGEDQARPANAAVGWIKDDIEDPLGLGPWLSNDRATELGGGSWRGGPAGGVWSTAGDMWRLVDAVATGQAISPSTREAMWGDRRRPGGRLGAALGFMFRASSGAPDAAPTFFGHSGGGGNAGVSTAVYVTPDRTWSVVVLSNFSSPAGEMLGGQLMDYLAGMSKAKSPSQ